MKLLLLVHLGATLCLVGLIWTIQVVHYPLMGDVGSDAFGRYHAAHSTAISWLVIPLMLTELGTALLLLRYPFDGSTVPAWVGLVLLGVIWLSTALLQVPQHGVLASGFNAEAHRVLVLSNWVRTFAWSARGVLVLWMVGWWMGD